MAKRIGWPSAWSRLYWERQERESSLARLPESFAIKSIDMVGRIYVAEVDVAPLRAAKLEKDRAKATQARKPREKTPAQWEAHWSRVSTQNAEGKRTGSLFQEHHLRMTLPAKARTIPDHTPKEKTDRE